MIVDDAYLIPPILKNDMKHKEKPAYKNNIVYKWPIVNYNFIIINRNYYFTRNYKLTLMKSCCSVNLFCIVDNMAISVMIMDLIDLTSCPLDYNIKLVKDKNSKQFKDSNKTDTNRSDLLCQRKK